MENPECNREDWERLQSEICDAFPKPPVWFSSSEDILDGPREIIERIASNRIDDSGKLIDKIHGYHIFRSVGCDLSVYFAGVHAFYLTEEALVRVRSGEVNSYRSDISDDLYRYFSGCFYSISDIKGSISSRYKCHVQDCFSETIRLMTHHQSPLLLYPHEKESLAAVLPEWM